ncbi:MAG: type II toxin-antitoxin system prevent-host-death family antitoxin [Deltaproteobacteria bacterium]|nr:MAG: type II toxin-antitoxin system prevent-host-death family antitoxin [Deltaproteobacteria bacterium]
MKEQTFSVYQTKAQFSKLLRMVQRRHKIIITHHGRPVAKLVPVDEEEQDPEKRLQELVELGIVQPARTSPHDSFEPLRKSLGALERFLEQRD